MKKGLLLVAVFMALVIAMPSASQAGSATSRWDLTIGGFVKFDMGWANQGVGEGWFGAERKSDVDENLLDEYGNIFMSSARTQLTFLVSGPSAFGAKTGAYIEAAFQGNAKGAPAAGAVWGAAHIRRAYMDFKWDIDRLIIGLDWINWQWTGFPAGVYEVAENSMTPFKAVRQPQVIWNRDWTKEFFTSFSLIYPANWAQQQDGSAAGIAGTRTPAGGAQNTVDNYTRAMIPDFGWLMEYKNPAWGRFSNIPLGFGFGGVVGKEKATYIKTAGAAGVGQDYADEWVDKWAAMLYAAIPLICQKDQNKTGSLGLVGGIVAGENMRRQFPLTFASYDQDNTANANFVSPTVWAWWGGLRYHFSDPFWVSAGVTMQYTANASRRWRNANINNVISENMYNVTFVYDVNPAIRFAVEGSHAWTRFAGQSAAVGTRYEDNGKLNTGRFTAFYYF